MLKDDAVGAPGTSGVDCGGMLSVLTMPSLPMA